LAKLIGIICALIGKGVERKNEQDEENVFHEFLKDLRFFLAAIILAAFFFFFFGA
jgi:hypothetical protein